MSKLSPRRAREIASKALGVRIPRSTIYRLIEDGRIESERIGTKILIDLKALEHFINRCKQGERY